MSTSLTSPRAAFATGESASLATPLSDLAERVAGGDLDVDSDAFVAVVTAARRRLVDEVLIGVLLDPAAPVVARQRAFGRVAAALAAAEPALAHRAA
jgi:hypothetical protein